MEWINVEEETPKHHEFILVWMPRLGDEGVIDTGYFVADTDHTSQKFVLCNDNEYFDSSDVTHWMPLPAPPKE